LVEVGDVRRATRMQDVRVMFWERCGRTRLADRRNEAMLELRFVCCGGIEGAAPGASDCPYSGTSSMCYSVN